MDRKEENRFSRRGFLKSAGKLAAGAAVGAVGLSAVAASAAPERAEAAKWEYKPVDPEKVYWNGVAGYYKNACSQGSFEAIMKELGEPFTTIPGYMMKWGEGGGVGMGSHCGALTGSSTAISLAFGQDPELATKMIKELTAWYQHDLGSGSPLCHISVTEWSKANGVTVESQERKDRCARVTGETAKKAVLLMNAAAAGQFKAEFPTANPSSAACISCHGKDQVNNVRNGVALQDCAPCHDTAHKQ
ncbi:MAG: C-GCAxxG-C-C family protein [Chloroflexota bacterium]